MKQPQTNERERALIDLIASSGGGRPHAHLTYEEQKMARSLAERGLLTKGKVDRRVVYCTIKKPLSPGLKLNLRTMTEAEQEADTDPSIEYWDTVRKEIGNPIAIWSMHKAPLDADAIAINSDQPVRIAYNASPEFGYRPCWTELPANPTFRELYKACASLIKLSRDHNHVFIECLDWNPEQQQFELWCGS